MTERAIEAFLTHKNTPDNNEYQQLQHTVYTKEGNGPAHGWAHGLQEVQSAAALHGSMPGTLDVVEHPSYVADYLGVDKRVLPELVESALSFVGMLPEQPPPTYIPPRPQDRPSPESQPNPYRLEYTIFDLRGNTVT